MKKPDVAALQRLAQRAQPRESLKAEGYHSLFHSSDLFAHGYRVRHWLRLTPPIEVLEYLPRVPELVKPAANAPRPAGLPRLTASCYAEQVEIHRALGLNLVPPGEPWRDYQQAGLFDGVLLPGSQEGVA